MGRSSRQHDAEKNGLEQQYRQNELKTLYRSFLQQYQNTHAQAHKEQVIC